MPAGVDVFFGATIITCIYMYYNYTRRQTCRWLLILAPAKLIFNTPGMGVTSGCGEQEAGVASGSGWNLWVWLLGVVVRRYINFVILLIPTPLVSVLFTAASLLFVH